MDNMEYSHFMEYSHLLNNVAILVMLALPYQYFVRRWGTTKLTTHVFMGLIFGAASIVGMLMSVVGPQGILLDAKTVVASVGALFCGPISAAVIVITAGAFRVWLGGPATLTGVLVLMASAAVGTGYHFFYRRRPEAMKPHALLLFGLVVHVLIFALMLTLNAPDSWNVAAFMAIPILVVCPLGTVVLGVLLANVAGKNRSEQAYREANEHLHLAASAPNIGLWDWDLRSGAVYFSKEWKRQLGYAENEIAGHYDEWESRLHPDDRDHAVQTVRGYLENPWPNYEDEFRLRHRDGSYRWILTRAEVIGDQNGKPYRMLGCHIDLTERKQTEQELRDSEAEYRNLVESVNSIILRMDVDGRVLFMNQFGLKFFGYSYDEILGKHVLDTIVPETDTTGADLRILVADILKNPDRYQNGENDNIRKNGQRVRVSWTNRAIRDNDGRCIEICCVGNDVTAHRRAEADLTKLGTAMEQAAEVIFITDDCGTIQYANAAIEKITGYARSEIIGKNPRMLASGKHDKAFYRDLWKTISTGGIWTGQFINKRKDGSLYNEEATISPIRGADGTITNYVAVKRDITLELSLEQQLRQAQKMEAVGQLAGGVAHDFNNILQVILGYGQLLEQQVPTRNADHEHAVEIVKAAERAAALTRQLLAFSRRQILDMENLDVNVVLDDIIKMIGRVIGEDIRLDIVRGTPVGTVRADSGQLEQIIMNLCVNARDAMPGGGILIIETGDAVLDEEYCSTHSGVVPGRFVTICVSDTGCGMDTATQERIFEPFFTTKAVGKGTGLGLATVYGIVKQHHGYIQVYSEVGKGSAFKIYLPMVANQSSMTPQRVQEEVVGGAETILIAEDDPGVRKLASRVLRGAGYTVLEAADGSQALDVFEKHSREIALIFLDSVMPLQSGNDVYKRLYAEHPELRFLFTSGYTTSNIHTDFVLKEGIEFIQKPYNSKALLQKVRKALS